MLLRPFLITVLSVAFIGSIAVVQQQWQSSSPSSSLRRTSRRLDEEQQQVRLVPVQQLKLDAEALVLKELTHSLCDIDEDPKFPPLAYDNCDPNGVLNVIPLMGGMTNALKMVLLGAIMSFEEGRCFYVDEEEAHLNPLKDGQREGFIQKYMQPIGLPKDHPYVVNAFKHGLIHRRTYLDYWISTDKRRIYGNKYDIPKLGYGDIEGHQLKRAFIRRMWRPLPQYKEATCNSLKSHDLGDEFIALSVRRGDKSLEKFAYTSLDKYIDAA
jgi:hypothetical protein